MEKVKNKNNAQFADEVPVQKHKTTERINFWLAYFSLRAISPEGDENRSYLLLKTQRTMA